MGPFRPPPAFTHHNVPLPSTLKPSSPSQKFPHHPPEGLCPRNNAQVPFLGSISAVKPTVPRRGLCKTGPTHA